MRILEVFGAFSMDPAYDYEAERRNNGRILTFSQPDRDFQSYASALSLCLQLRLPIEPITNQTTPRLESGDRIYPAEYKQLNAHHEIVSYPASFLSPRPYIPVA
jgi:hypothetical protein